jgi:hypothetical protein
MAALVPDVVFLIVLEAAHILRASAILRIRNLQHDHLALSGEL